MMNIFAQSVDFSKVDVLLYHLPEGPTLSMRIDGLGDFLDIELEAGYICDTSDIDGVVHFFPKGNA